MKTRVPALRIAAFVRERGACYSTEILDQFLISEQTLRRRRPELRRLGLVFVENGRGSFYATDELADRLPTASLPKEAPATTPAVRHSPDRGAERTGFSPAELAWIERYER